MLSEINPGFHRVLSCVPGAIEANREDGLVAAIVVTVGASGIDEDVGICVCETPDVGKIT